MCRESGCLSEKIVRGFEKGKSAGCKGQWKLTEGVCVFFRPGLGFRFLSVFNGLKSGDRDGYFGVSEVKWVAVKAVVSVMEVGWDRCALLRVWTVREEIGGH